MSLSAGLAILPPLIAGLLAAWALGRWLLAVRGEPRPVVLALTGLRAAVFTLLLLAILNPAIRRPGFAPSQPSLTFLVDASASMALPGEGAATRRQEATQALRSPLVSGKLRRFRLTRLDFAAGLLPPPAPESPTAPVTNLELALRQVAATDAPQALVVVSDGLETQGDALAAARDLAARGVKVSTVGVGSLTPPPDAALLGIEAPRLVKEQQPFPVSLTAVARGTKQAGELTLSRGDSPLRKLPLPPGDRAVTLKATLPGLPAGVHLFTATLRRMPGEATQANNQRSFFVEARRDQAKLSLVAGAPSPEIANLRRALVTAPRTELRSWVRVGPGRYLTIAGDRARPGPLSWAAALKGCHVLLVANLEPGGVDAAAVARFVREGGALALLGGPQGLGGAAVADLSPFASGSGTYQAVPVGVALPEAATPLGADLLHAGGLSRWRAAPFLAGANLVSGVKPPAQVPLRTRAGQPLLASQPVGLGRCLAFASDGSYRWVLSPEADETSRRLHQAFWGSVTTWLAMPRDDSQVVMLLDPPIAPYGLPTRALVQVSRGLQPVTSARVKVTVRPVPGRTSSLATAQDLACQPTTTPGRYQVALSGLDPGRYEVTARATASGPLGTAKRTLVVEPGGAEVAELTQQEGFLRQLAAAGGGEYVTLAGLGGLLDRLPAGAPPREITVPVQPFRSLWAFVAVLALCTADWVLRRRHGL